VDALIEILTAVISGRRILQLSAGQIGNRKLSPSPPGVDRKPLREPVLKALGISCRPRYTPSVIAAASDPQKISRDALRTIEKMYHNGIPAGK